MTNRTAFFGSITNNGSPSIQGSVVWRMDMTTGNIDGKGATWSNFTAGAGANWNGNGVDFKTYVSNRVDYQTIPFIVTNAKYEVCWIGPWDEVRTIEWQSAKLDNSTVTVDLVENVFTNGTWRGFTTNNSIAAGTTGIKDSTLGDSTVAIGNCLGIRLRACSATATQGFSTVKMRY